MLQLVRHFGDQEDSGARCGTCDFCAPGSSVALSFRAPDDHERLAMERILDALAAHDGQATGRLHREVFGDSLNRNDFEKLIGALVRSGWLHEREDSFEKDGRAIEFRRVFLVRAPGAAPQLDEVRLIVEPVARKRTTRGSRRGAARAVTRDQADGLEQREADPRIVEALRAWRLEQARREQVPAFCVMSNRTLEGIARLRPRTEDDLFQVRGVGARVVERWGRAILSIVRDEHGRAPGTSP